MFKQYIQCGAQSHTWKALQMQGEWSQEASQQNSFTNNTGSLPEEEREEKKMHSYFQLTFK